MNIVFVGSFNERRCIFNIHETEYSGSELVLRFPYSFVNISFSIKNSTIRHQQILSHEKFGLFMECDFSSMSPSPCKDPEERYRQQNLQWKEKAKKYDFIQKAEEWEQITLR